MTKLPIVILALAGSAYAGGKTDKKDKKDLVTAQLDELRAAAKCDDKASVWRPWCIAADWSKGTAGDLPKGKVLVGLTIELEQGKSASDALSNKVTLVARDRRRRQSEADRRQAREQGRAEVCGRGRVQHGGRVQRQGDDREAAEGSQRLLQDAEGHVRDEE